MGCDGSRSIDFIKGSMRKPAVASAKAKRQSCAGDTDLGCIARRLDDNASRCSRRASPSDVGYHAVGTIATPSLMDIRNLGIQGQPVLPPGATWGADKVVSARQHSQTLEPRDLTLTIRQFRGVFAHCVGSPEFQRCKEQRGFVTMDDVRNLFIKPWVEDIGCSLASLMKASLDHPRPAQMIVCGSPGDDVEEFMQAMDNFVKKHGVDDDTSVWFSLFSCPLEDNIDEPRHVSFQNVLACPELLKKNGGHGVVVIHTSQQDLYERLNVLYEVDEALSKKHMVRCAASKAYVARTVRMADTLIKQGFDFDYCVERLTVVMSEEAKVASEDNTKMIGCLKAKGGFPRLNRDMREFRKRMLPREVIQQLSSFCIAKRK